MPEAACVMIPRFYQLDDAHSASTSRARRTTRYGSSRAAPTSPSSCPARCAKQGVSSDDAVVIAHPSARRCDESRGDAPSVAPRTSGMRASPVTLCEASLRDDDVRGLGNCDTGPGMSPASAAASRAASTSSVEFDAAAAAATTHEPKNL